MPMTILSPKSNQDSQFFIRHKFSLADLIDLVPAVKLFEIETKQIELNMSSNFTFGTDHYMLRLPKSPDNQKRILYYALLCYLFEMCNDMEASKYQEAFVEYVLNQCEVILPFKRVCTKDHKTTTPMMTTNQIKASFAKFINLLKQRIRMEKMVLEEITTLPQIDFVFMSIFQMYIRKTTNIMEECTEKFLRDFGIQIQVTEEGFVLNNDCEVQKKSSDDEWDRFFISKIDSKKPAELKRKATTQSIGEIDEEEPPKTERELNENLHFEELINARFVESCEAQDSQRFDKDTGRSETKRKVPNFFRAHEQDRLFIKKEMPNIHVCDTTVSKSKPKHGVRRTSFLNQNIYGSKMMMIIERERSKQRKMKTEGSSKNLNGSKQKNPGNYRPWSPKLEKNENNFKLYSSKHVRDAQQVPDSKPFIKISLCTDSIKEHSFVVQELKPSHYQIRIPEKRQTLQRLTFNYGNPITPAP